MAPHQLSSAAPAPAAAPLGCLASTDRYYLRVVRPEDTEEVFQFLRRFYYPFEPVNQSVNRIPVNIYQCSHGETIKEGLSLAAIERDTGKLIGVSIQGVATPEDDAEVMKKVEAVANYGAVKIAKSFEIVAVLEREADIWSKLNVTESLRVLATAVDSDYRGLGVGAAFVVASARLAADRSIRWLSVAATSHYFANACKRLGGELVHSVRYDRFVDEHGRPHLPVKAPHQAMTMWVFDTDDLLSTSPVNNRPRRQSATGA
ncbi:hypothetical protein ONE63_007864 [Megalurothrips usitatus]|uniref:aralkylamine N-acetyltransferase n=1 Tax=Megalurothrips usitatus TaxID=439358 RepID=A0AAV7XQ40_9NEOP|nr:hypothetical protein ONE63_007864 [Megalurothrips usitatus]